VEYRTFAGQYAAQRGQEVLYITERCVFRLRPDGLELIEVAPGVDVQRDILDRMDFAPLIGTVREMNALIFRDVPMGLRPSLVGMPFDARFSYDAAKNTLFINFERFEVRSMATIQAITDKIRSIVEPLGQRVHAVVNYEGFVLDRDMEDAWAHSVSETVGRWYDGVTRYTTSAFLRAKLGDAMAQDIQSRHPDAEAETLQRERDKPSRAPCIIAVAAHISKPHKVPESEQVLAAGAAVQNMFLAAHALGYGVMWKTGPAAYSSNVKRALGLQEDDHIVALLYLGTLGAPGPQRAPLVEGRVQWLD
jgi:hypothetical protein